MANYSQWIKLTSYLEQHCPNGRLMHTAFTASKHNINLPLWGKGTAFAPDSHRIHGLSQEHLLRLNFGKKQSPVTWKKVPKMHTHTTQLPQA